MYGLFKNGSKNRRVVNRVFHTKSAAACAALKVAKASKTQHLSTPYDRHALVTNIDVRQVSKYGAPIKGRKVSMTCNSFGECHINTRGVSRLVKPVCKKGLWTRTRLL